MKSKTISISAISAGFLALILTVGAYIEMVDLFCIVISSVFVILPLYYKSFIGSFLTFIVGGVVALLFSGFNFISLVFPSYFFFFGLYPVVTFLMREKRINKLVIFIVGLIWCVSYFYGAYFYYTLIMNMTIENLPKFIADYILYIVPIVGAIFYVIYHRFIYVVKIWADRCIARIIK